MALADFFGLSGILARIQTFFGPLGKLFDSLKQSYDKLINVFGSGQKLVQSIVAEVNAWRNFKQDIRIKQRVVQIERAVTKTRDLIAGIPAAWRSIVDIVKQFKETLTQETSPIDEAEAATADIESGGIKTIIEKFPALAKGLEKVLGALALVLQALETIASVIDDIQTVVDEITRLREEIEKLDTIFLPQSNKRKTLKLADGSTIRIRVGKLHQLT